MKHTQSIPTFAICLNPIQVGEIRLTDPETGEPMLWIKPNGVVGIPYSDECYDAESVGKAFFQWAQAMARWQQKANG